MKVQQGTLTPNINQTYSVSGIGVKSNTNVEKATVGYKLNINNDRAVVLGINDNQAQMHKIKDAVRKSNDGSALIKTFEGALGETVNIIRRMKALALEASNPEYTDEDRVVIETEYRELCSSVDELANVSYNDCSLLCGNSDLTEVENIVNIEVAPETLNAVNNIALRSIGTVSCGDLTVTGNNLVEGTDYTYSDNTLTILSNKSMILSGTSTVDHVVVKSGVNANLTLDNLDLRFNDGSAAFNSADWQIGTCAFKIEDNSSGNISITLVGNNTLESGAYCAGLQKSGGVSTGTLTIGGVGTLTAVGRGGAGIGGKAGDSKPKGYYDGSLGISTTEASGCNIVINSGTINASTVGLYRPGYGNQYSMGAAIGGGTAGDGRNITINGGNIRAVSVAGAGIGGGNDPTFGFSGDVVGGNGVNIVINGGTIYAKGECGIGSVDGYETNIAINGGQVTAEGNTAIGSSGATTERPQNGHKIAISGGEVLAVSEGNVYSDGQYFYGAGIGTSHLYNGHSSELIPADITISGQNTVVIAYSKGYAGKGGGDNIGNGHMIDENNVTHTIDSSIALKSGLISEEFNGMTALGNITGGTIVHYDPNAAVTPDPDPTPDPNPTPDPKPTVGNESGLKPTVVSKPAADFGIVFQMGARSKDAVRFTFDYASNGIGYLQNDLDCTSNGLGLNSLSLDTEGNAVYALDRMDYALNKATAVMSKFTTARNKIASVADSLQNPDVGFIYDNDNVEDTDVASELSEYVKQFIVGNADDGIKAQSAQISQAMALLE